MDPELQRQMMVRALAGGAGLGGSGYPQQFEGPHDGSTYDLSSIQGPLDLFSHFHMTPGWDRMLAEGRRSTNIEDYRIKPQRPGE
jgi:hypothetical protein